MDPTVITGSAAEDAFATAHRSEAAALGRTAGDLIQDPAAVAAALRSGLGRFRDMAGDDRDVVLPQPLIDAVGAGLLEAMRDDRSSTVLDVAAHLLRADGLELQLLAITLLGRTIGEEPERTWQLLRAAARTAASAEAVDALARVAAPGILAEPYRWAELEQLVYSPSAWERRLVGSAIAAVAGTATENAGDAGTLVRHGLGLVRDLIGDDDRDVQVSLASALRALGGVDRTATADLLRSEAAVAARDADGNRAAVIRDTLDGLPIDEPTSLRHAIDAITSPVGPPSTSRAAATASAFMGLGVEVPPAERPIVERP